MKIPNTKPSEMSRIRKCYGVPAKRGMVIIYSTSDGDKVECLIVGSRNNRLRVKMSNRKGGWNEQTCLLHPKWNVIYPNENIEISLICETCNLWEPYRHLPRDEVNTGYCPLFDKRTRYFDGNGCDGHSDLYNNFKKNENSKHYN